MGELPDDLIIWKYMDLPKFLDLNFTSELKSAIVDAQLNKFHAKNREINVLITNDV